MNTTINKTVITYGTFDLFHVGHLKLLQKAGKLGEKLIVAISTDEFNELKGKHSIIKFEDRKLIVENIKGVDLVIIENSWEQKIQDIINYKVDVFVMGDDWEGKFDFLKEYCEVIYLKRTKNISTSDLKKSYKYVSNIDLKKFNDALMLLQNITLNLK